MNRYTFSLMNAQGRIRINVIADTEPEAWEALRVKIERADAELSIWMPRLFGSWLITNVE